MSYPSHTGVAGAHRGSDPTEKRRSNPASIRAPHNGVLGPRCHAPPLVCFPRTFQPRSRPGVLTLAS